MLTLSMFQGYMCTGGRHYQPLPQRRLASLGHSTYNDCKFALEARHDQQADRADTKYGENSPVSRSAS